jgi:hypothetical protein
MSMLTNKNHCHKITSRGKESKVNSRIPIKKFINGVQSY